MKKNTKTQEEIFFKVALPLWAFSPASFFVPFAFLWLPIVASVYTYVMLNKIIEKHDKRNE